VPAEMIAIMAPKQGVYRLGWRQGDVFAPPPWHFARAQNGTFGGRFDDSGMGNDGAPEERFRMVYCATNRICGLMESTAHFRQSVSFVAKLDGGIVDTGKIPDEAFSGLVDPDDALRGVIPASWRMEHQFGHAFLDPSLRFADLGAAATLNHLRRAMANVVVELGIDDIDLSAVTGPHRRLTQRIARYVYEQVDDEGKPRFAGIRYLSHHGDNQECWAVFDTRTTFRETDVEPNILPDDADLLVVARMFGLTVEVLDGQYTRP